MVLHLAVGALDLNGLFYYASIRDLYHLTIWLVLLCFFFMSATWGFGAFLMRRLLVNFAESSEPCGARGHT